MEEQFKYDVAFSFLEQDKQIALAITDLIRDRVNVFVYPERQEELVGVDGHEKFSQVFSEESRIVVVLHREGWGDTPWTRLEETAIKNRGFNNGYDFVTFIPLENHNVRPKWIPQTRIWPSFDKYGIDGVATTIEARVQSAGGNVRGESIIEHAARLQRELTFRQNKTIWFGSDRGVQDATQEVGMMIEYLKETAGKITEQSPSLNFAFEQRKHEQFILNCNGFSLSVTWNLRYTNTLNESLLHLQLFYGHLSLSGTYYYTEKPSLITKITYTPDLDLQLRPGWIENTKNKRFSRSQQLADFWLKKLLDSIENYKKPSSNPSVFRI